MYYTVYQTTNLLTNEIYVGQHVTKNLDDGYLGSGTILRNKVKTHGKENFKKEILYVFDNFEEMDNKEKEIVNEEFIKRSDTMNIILGGAETNMKHTVIVGFKESPDKRFRIHKDEYLKNKHLYQTVNTGRLFVKNSAGDEFYITSEEYAKNKHLYKTKSHGLVSVTDLRTNESYSIKTTDFNPEIHKKVLGGIVTEIDGKRQYISKEEFDKNGCAGVHKGKITVRVKGTDIIKHIPTEEFHKNKNLYSHMTEGYVTTRNKITGECGSFLIEYVNKDRENWIVGTEGYRTVFSIECNKFINIRKEDYDAKLYRGAHDKKIICYEPNGEIRFTFWGSKSDFLKQYNGIEELWKCILKEDTFKSKRTCLHFNGCSFKLVDWKKETLC